MHWRRKAKAVKDARQTTMLFALASGWKPGVVPTDGRLHLWVDFVPPDRRRRDLDNCIASMKAGLDGLADALGVDDNRWRLVCKMADGEVGGFVAVTVE